MTFAAACTRTRLAAAMSAAFSPPGSAFCLDCPDGGLASTKDEMKPQPTDECKAPAKTFRPDFK
jgi:hypothetical protein